MLQSHMVPCSTCGMTFSYDDVLVVVNDFNDHRSCSSTCRNCKLVTVYTLTNEQADSLIMDGAVRITVPAEFWDRIHNPVPAAPQLTDDDIIKFGLMQPEEAFSGLFTMRMAN